ncbi:hypothetical protein CBS12448_202 [Aspergillus niger]|nr:hypothetical protein CBS11350_1534 [Aspergillus niger]KAI2867756.1 hypothetical protein CBS12448_202 [Aspergillus niger]KAI2979725.1 hypothetical protein CBS147324_577 [Aspergillus niger]KAI3058949.1 hypothetical protein CBS147352_959 [Aspergillus niger]
MRKPAQARPARQTDFSCINVYSSFTKGTRRGTAGGALCLSKSSPVFPDESQPSCLSQQKKKQNSSCGQPTAATHSNPSRGREPLSPAR